MATYGAFAGVAATLRTASSGYFWARLCFGAFSRIAPGAAAWALHALYRRPALTRRYSRRERALLRDAATLLKGAERLDTPVVTRTGRGVLRAYHFRSDGQTRGLALLLHGWTADARAMAAFIGPLVAAGYDALVVDLPAHGGSSGVVTDAESGADAVASMLAARGLTPDHVIGHSFGGAVSSVLAAAGATPRSVVSIAAPSAMAAALDELALAYALSDAARARLLARAGRLSGRPLDEYDVRRIWRARDSAILVIHAPEDDSVSYTHAERFRALPNARLAPTHGVGHREIVRHQACIEATMAHITSVDRVAI
ncbi:alpha/beta fold hydrolase [Pikeienuella piscinae]|uniref:Alpha/beta fold hydrolase n=1 Tax=Pikeienuella piscinae TaxID=2748098 RepID=A0A7L5BZR9_9RHOB|nr:alpha/beta hydrolase [Pikeienuella piscinae]QIE55364.1 alpha/beta fold hydrolase [Pikeienuella piscinae]